MSKLSFDVSVEDKESARQHRDARQFTILQIAGEEYAAVRPAPSALSMMITLASSIRQMLASPDTQDEAVIAINQFVNQAFLGKAVREALIHSGQFEPDGDDDELSAEGVSLAQSHQRLLLRWLDGDDDLGATTLADVIVGLAEHWTGKPTGLPSGSSDSRKGTGGSSMANRSRTGSTSSKSSSGRRRVS